MYWFGKNIDSQFDWRSEDQWRFLDQRKRSFSKIKTDEILSVLDRLSKEDFSAALPELVLESGFSEEETRATLNLLPMILSREGLEKRIRAEFIRPEILDRFVKLPHGMAKVRATPLGTILHVTAGNVFLSSIDSLIMGLLTKNISILKVSSSNKFFPFYFAEKLKAVDENGILCDKFAILHWKGGDEASEAFIKTKVNGIIAWGGEEMLQNYKRDLPLHVKLLDFGPKVSFQLISSEGIRDKNLTKVAEKIVADIVPWDQSACASPQNLYLQEGIDSSVFLKQLENAFNRTPNRGQLDDDEATEMLKETYRGYWSELMEGGRVQTGKNHLVHLEASKILRPSPLHRSLIIKRYRDIDELVSLLAPFSYYLQSCSYLLGADEKDHYLGELSITGIKRFAPLGTVTWGTEGAPHDGRFVLRELTDFIADEIRAIDYGEEMMELQSSLQLKKSFSEVPHPEGYIFSSGGTTGEPKYVHFSYEEFDYMSDMLAHNLRRQGVRSGMTVANLFVAGNLWSSFLCVEKALEKIGVIQLPIGGMCSQENIQTYLQKFRPDVVMGIPSMLVMTAEYTHRRGGEFQVPMIFYAGEALSETRRKYLTDIWKVQFFGSAGYASVDAGVIGYQCAESQPGEHHVFSDLIDLKIIDDEAIVTSIVRTTMPIRNYRTGDRIEWIGPCTCGSLDKRFRLLGRVDSVIQIWSCRLLVSDVEDVLAKFGIMTFQIKIYESMEGNLIKEKMQIICEEDVTNEAELMSLLYQCSRDVRDTISLDYFKSNLKISRGEVSRHERTGKISLVLDQRR
jgi:phenylacetate-CoA ligase